MIKKTNDLFLKKRQFHGQLLGIFPGIKLSKILTTIKPVKIDELVKKAKEIDPAYKPPNFHSYFAIDYPIGIDENMLLIIIKKLKTVESAYLEGESTVAQLIDASDDERAVHQNYLDAARIGIDARYVWNMNIEGADGRGAVKFIDIEQGWILNHEDFLGASLSELPGGNTGDNRNYKGHGTSVLGIIMAQDNAIGCVGITPNIQANVVSKFRPDGTDNIADAIFTACAYLSFGDIMLLELQKTIGIRRLPVEVEDHIFNAMRLASALGIVVIEPAGNGSIDLDNYQDSSSLKFILNRNNQSDFRDSGAIMVGAATANLLLIDHVRTPESNYGSRIDCYAWGQNINTTGDGNLGTGIDTYIPVVSIPPGERPSGFEKTSGASAIIAGVAISVQSMIEAAYQFRYSPLQLREVMKSLKRYSFSNF